MKKNKKMETNNYSEKYIVAQKKVEELKQFYKHLSVYILVNLFFIARRIYKDIKLGDSLEEVFFDIDNYRFFFWWGIILVIHGVKVYSKQNLFSKNWEERKIKEYMNEK
ncbi:2TM domain-containing protein [Tenacibaculum retecalamus]|uniref:2TM domain-containing protein n=1 Tax=Tenacibaculum retecalamus TaxID=3018315 RepID=UPI0023D90C64|nr:2TM domain-containing protein [Tenacibaculum retecalamus]WBX70417.1 2TM domain-containing protein [Tenacibaculum retecalamus]